jgi:hypothetical protein
MVMGDRYFPATAMGGRLHLDAAAGTDSLSAQNSACCDETIVDMPVARVGHREARTWEELSGILAQSLWGLRAIRIWVRADLKGAVRRLG